MLDIRPAITPDDLHAVYRFRYAVYVEEMARPQKDADHAAKLIADPLDVPAAYVLAAWEGGWPWGIGFRHAPGIRAAEGVVVATLLETRDGPLLDEAAHDVVLVLADDAFGESLAPEEILVVVLGVGLVAFGVDGEEDVAVAVVAVIAAFADERGAGGGGAGGFGRLHDAVFLVVPDGR